MLTNRDGVIIKIDRDRGVVEEFTPDETVETVDAVVFDADGPVYQIGGSRFVRSTSPRRGAPANHRRGDEVEQFYTAAAQQVRRTGELDPWLSELQADLTQRTRLLVNSCAVTLAYRELTGELGLNPRRLTLQQLSQLRTLTEGTPQADGLARVAEQVEELVRLDAEIRELDADIANTIATLPAAAQTIRRAPLSATRRR